MNRLLTFAAAAVAACAMSTAASAGIVNFADYASGNEHGVASGTSVNIDGVNMTLTSNFNPYFDDVDGGKPAGLGVCRELTTNLQCSDSSDDSTDGDLGVLEYVIIAFDDGPFSVLDISFRDGSHNLLNDDDASLVEWAVFDGGGMVLFGGIDTFADVVLLAISGVFANIDGIGFRFADTEFYVEYISDVPVPAALPLLLSGLAGLGFASRRKKTA